MWRFLSIVLLEWGPLTCWGKSCLHSYVLEWELHYLNRIHESLRYWWMIHDKGHLSAIRKIYSKSGLPWFFYRESADFELVGFKNADLAIAFIMGSAFPSWCSNKQPLFNLIHRREVSGINSRDCRMLIVGKIALRLETKTSNITSILC